MNNGARLPFPRGLTASAGIQIAGPTGTLISQLPTTTGLVGEATAYRPDLAGLVVETTDTVLGTKRPMRLRCVQAAADITVARKGIQFSSTAKLFGAVTASTPIPSSGTAGLAAAVIDPAYATGKVIPKYDWFYVVEEGPAQVLVGTQVTAGGSVMIDGNGKAAPATAGSAVIGTADQTVAADSNALVWITGGLVKSDAAS